MRKNIDTVVHLPSDWNHMDGLHYPTFLTLNGEKVKIESYQQHHLLILKLFKPQKNEPLSAKT